MRNGKTDRFRGFSITELLVVIAIIGLMVLVVVPNFITYYKTNKMRISVRQFTTDVRRARQTAITSHSDTKLSFKKDGSSGEYRFYKRNNDCNGVGVSPDPDPCWQVLAPVKKNLEATIFFGTGSTFTDIATGISPDPDGIPDIVFKTDGTVSNLPSGTGTVVLATNNNIPKKQFTVTFYPTGRLATN